MIHVCPFSVKPGVSFEYTWTVLNCGQQAWTEDTQLNLMSCSQVDFLFNSNFRGLFHEDFDFKHFRFFPKGSPHVSVDFRISRRIQKDTIVFKLLEIRIFFFPKNHRSGGRTWILHDQLICHGRFP